MNKLEVMLAMPAEAIISMGEAATNAACLQAVGVTEEQWEAMGAAETFETMAKVEALQRSAWADAMIAAARESDDRPLRAGDRVQALEGVEANYINAGDFGDVTEIDDGGAWVRWGNPAKPSGRRGWFAHFRFLKRIP